MPRHDIRLYESLPLSIMSQVLSKEIQDTQNFFLIKATVYIDSNFSVKEHCSFIEMAGSLTLYFVSIRVDFFFKLYTDCVNMGIVFYF